MLQTVRPKLFKDSTPNATAVGMPPYVQHRRYILLNQFMLFSSLCIGNKVDNCVYGIASHFYPSVTDHGKSKEGLWSVCMVSAASDKEPLSLIPSAQTKQVFDNFYINKLSNTCSPFVNQHVTLWEYRKYIFCCSDFFKVFQTLYFSPNQSLHNLIQFICNTLFKYTNRLRQ